jgi:hypothetical protein
MLNMVDEDLEYIEEIDVPQGAVGAVDLNVLARKGIDPQCPLQLRCSPHLQLGFLCTILTRHRTSCRHGQRCNPCLREEFLDENSST